MANSKHTSPPDKLAGRDQTCVWSRKWACWWSEVHGHVVAGITLM